MALNLFAAAAEVKKDSLVEFRAGKMNMDLNTKIVRADKRKGLVQLKHEDGLIHFIWKDRSSNQAETDLMIFRDDAVFRKVVEAKARVYVLEFKASNKKLFFWMQEPSDEKDEQYATDINKFINNPPEPGTNAQGGADDKGLGGLDQNQLLQFLANAQGSGNLSGLRELLQRGAGGGTPTAQRTPTRSTTSQASPTVTRTQPTATSTTTVSRTTTSSTSSSVSGPISSATSNALKNIVANFAKDKVEPSLSDVVNSEEILKSGILDNEEIVKKLVEFLPEGQVTAENLKENLNSPQFKEAIRNFNQALRSGELATIAVSFGLDASSIGPNSSIEDFLLAIQKQSKDEKK